LTGKIAWSRVYRGGTWDSAAAVCRSASRNGYLPTFRSTVGFRVALDPSERPGE
jgi:formylglycine-generating enzyme required for sulfatase activity